MRFRLFRSSAASFALLTSVMVLSCDNCTSKVTQPGSFAISASPMQFSVEAGSSYAATIVVTRDGSFTGAVSLAIQGAPTGVTAAFTPPIVAAGSTNATLSYTVASTATPGVYPVTVVGSATGMSDQRVTMSMTITAQQVGGFTISVDPVALSVLQGQAGTASVTISRTAPFAGSVTLSLEGAPTGVVASFAPEPVPAGATQSTLTITVGASVTPGVYPLQVRGVGTGDGDHSAALTLTVTATGSFALSLNPTTLSVQQGQGGTTAVTIARTAPFAGAVNLALDDAPAGVTASFAPGPIPAGGTTSTATISVAASVAPATYQLYIHGSGSGGVVDQLASLSLTVTAAPPPTKVDLVFCHLEARPVWIGYQDGNGPWQQVIGDGNGTYSFNLTADRGGVAYVMRETEGAVTTYDVSLVYATKGEFVEAAPLACESSQPVKSLTGTVPGLTGADFFAVAVGDGYAQILPGSGVSDFTIGGATTGVRDLIAGRLRTNQPLLPPDLIIRRQTDYPAGSAIPALDFGSGEAFAAEFRNATIVGLGGDQIELVDDYITANRTFGYLPYFTPTGPATKFPTVPSAHVVAGDIYNLKAIATSLGGAATREVTNSFASPADQTLTLGGPLVQPSVFVLTAAPFYQVQITTALQGDYPDVFSGRYEQPDRTGTVYVTAGWLGGSAVNLTTPDLRTVPGWLADYGPKQGVTTTLTARGYGLTGSSGSLVPLWGQAITTGGVVIKSATLSKQVVP